MFENAGKKLRFLAEFGFWISSVILIARLVYIFIDEGEMLLPAVYTAIGILVAYITAFLIYAFGELCENVHEINNKLQNNKDSWQN